MIPAPARERWTQGVVAALAVLAVAAQLAALRLPRGPLWGGNAAAFLSPLVLVSCLAIVVAVAYLAHRRAPGAAPPRALTGAIVLVLSAVVFWTFRVRHVLLGDGQPLTAMLPESHGIHPREPLASVIQQGLWRVLGPLFSSPGRPREHVVQDCVAVGSVLAGVAFVWVVRALARELVRSFRARDEEDVRRLSFHVALALLAQGYVLLFFGYVENYAYFALAAAIYVLAALRFARGSAPLLAPLAALALCVALHLAAVVLAPSALVLVIAGFADPARRAAAARDLALAMAGALAALAALAWGPAHLPVASNLATMLASGRAGADYLFSAAHVRDFLNEHWLLGPFGLFLFLPLAALALFPIERPRTARVFLLVLGLAAAAACWSTPDLPMGYARDWDLFAPFGVALAAGALGLALSLTADAASRMRIAWTVGMVAMLHTVPWIALNTSEVRSVQRFATLPLGEGRTESTLAWWYAQRHDYAEAKRWIRRAVVANPGNSRAVDLFGRIALEEGNPALAVRAYRVAIELRPDKPEYRQMLAVALAAAAADSARRAASDSTRAPR